MATFDDLAAREPNLAALARLVASTDPGDDPQWCANGFWQGAVKPLLAPLVGWDRGRAPVNAADPDGRDPWVFLDVRAALGALDDEQRWTRPVTTAAEELLRSPRAWDVAVGYLYGLLPACRDCGCLRVGEVAA